MRPPCPGEAVWRGGEAGRARCQAGCRAGERAWAGSAVILGLVVGFVFPGLSQRPANCGRGGPAGGGQAGTSGQSGRGVSPGCSSG